MPTVYKVQSVILIFITVIPSNFDRNITYVVTSHHVHCLCPSCVVPLVHLSKAKKSHFEFDSFSPTTMRFGVDLFLHVHDTLLTRYMHMITSLLTVDDT